MSGDVVEAWGSSHKHVDLFIVDIDNTLYDWFGFWLASFNAMVGAVVEVIGIPREQLLSEIREIHRRHGTSEYSFLLQELPSISRLESALQTEVISLGRTAYRTARDKTLTLFPGVKETLSRIKSTGTSVVGFTESQLFYTTQRLRRFGLDGLIDALYCARDHAIPDQIDLEKLRSRATADYGLLSTKTVLLEPGVHKPDPHILLEIVQAFASVTDRTVYVGDSLYKDVLMAQRAQVHDVFAKYGQVASHEGYDLLRFVSHWTPEQIFEDRQANAVVKPSITLDVSLYDIFKYFSFGRMKSTVEN